MAKKGTKQPGGEHKQHPLIANADGKVFHSIPYTLEQIPAAFPALDNDLAVENLTNDFDLTAADMQDLS